MTRAEFEAELRREGYEVSEGEITPDVHRPLHAHDFDVRMLVLDGRIALELERDRVSFDPGDTCAVPAGTLHAEHTGAAGVRYLLGKRAAAPRS
jgi:mannose-6-phosphate isomerase-like protein (cupin superfamily)